MGEISTRIYQAQGSWHRKGDGTIIAFRVLFDSSNDPGSKPTRHDWETEGSTIEDVEMPCLQQPPGGVTATILTQTEYAGHMGLGKKISSSTRPTAADPETANQFNDLICQD